MSNRKMAPDFILDPKLRYHWIIVYSLSILIVTVNGVQERIVTDLAIIESSFGVSIDFSYNETTSGRNELLSSPGCPKSIDGYPWIYYGKTRRCFLAGYKGPCPDGRLLYKEKDSLCGICSCDCFSFTKFSTAERSPDGKYTFCSFNQVHDHKRKTCYDLQQQGPCEKDQWLVKDKTGLSATCAPACTSDPSEQWTWNYDHVTGECTQFGRFGIGGASQPLLPNQCFGEAEHFSSILKKCVPLNTLDSLILG